MRVKPARLIAILFMVSVLAVMLAVPFFAMSGFRGAMRDMTTVRVDDGDPVNEGTNLLDDTYGKVTVSGQLDLKWIRAEKSKFEVHGPAELVSRTRVRKSGDSIQFSQYGHIGHGGTVTIDYYGPQPEALAIVGSGSITAKSLKDQDIDLSIAGSGNLTVGGSAKQVQINVAGSGSVLGFDLAADTTDVSISGSGTAKVNTKNKLDANITGSGEVQYKGNPEVDRAIIGSGSIQRQD